MIKYRDYLGPLLVLFIIGFCYFLKMLADFFIKKIITRIQKEWNVRKIKKILRNSSRASNCDEAKRQQLSILFEINSLYKFVLEGDITGLYELGEKLELSPKTLKLLIETAANYEPNEEEFHDIIEIVRKSLTQKK